MTTSDMRLSLRERLAYGSGDIASNLFWTTFTAYLMIFYTDVFGISASSAGAMLLFTGFWAAAFDPMVGAVADRTRTRWGHFRPWLLWMAAPFAIMGVLTFTTPELDGAGKLVHAYVTYTLMMMVYTAINIPYSALLGVLSPSSGERTTVSSVRFVCAFASAMCVLAITPHPVDYFGRNNSDIVAASISGGTLELKERGTGTAKLIVSASDPQGSVVSEEVFVRVLRRGHRPPRVVPPSDLPPRTGFDNAEDGKGGVPARSFPVTGEKHGNARPSLVAPLDIPRLEAGFSSYRVQLDRLFTDADGEPLTFSVNVYNQARGYQRTAALYGAFALLLFLITFAGTRERVQPDARPSATSLTARRYCPKILKDILSLEAWQVRLLLSPIGVVERPPHRGDAGCVANPKVHRTELRQKPISAVVLEIPEHPGICGRFHDELAIVAHVHDRELQRALAA